MQKADPSTPVGNRLRACLRVLRPLLWWFILLLVLFGIRTHQRLMEQTRLSFQASVEGLSVNYEIRPTFDDRAVSTGEQIPLGFHRFQLTHPKADPFTTNLFVWYGSNDLGQFTLKRATGTLEVQSSPPATRLFIRGPEFGTELTNSAGASVTVPTDRYDIVARFAFSEEKNTALVLPHSTSRIHIAPGLGVAHITCSHSNASYSLIGKRHDVRLNGELPATINDLPTGDYEAMIERLGQQQKQSFRVNANRTNDVLIKLAYGAVSFETEPTGVTIFDAHHRPFGETPLNLEELSPGLHHFTLERPDYQSLTIEVDVVVNQTNVIHTNLVTRRYAAALQEARDYLTGRQYGNAAEAARQALIERPDDPIAKSIERQATGLSHLERARAEVERGAMDEAIAEVDKTLETIPENAEAKQLRADYTAQKTKIDEEKHRRDRAAEAAATREDRIKTARATLDQAAKGFSSHASYAPSVQETVVTNDVKVLGEAIVRVLKDLPHKFEVHRYEWLQPYVFVIGAKETVEDGLRQAMLVGYELETNQCFICFQVVEFQRPHSASVLGGLVTVQLTNEADRNGEREAKFRSQVAQGVPIVNAKILRAIRESSQK